MSKYIVVVRQMNNGKYMLRFPDFEGVSNVAETDTTINKIANDVLSGKIDEFKMSEIEIPEPLTMAQVAPTLDTANGEFITFIDLNEKKSNIPNINLGDTFKNVGAGFKKLSKKASKVQITKSEITQKESKISGSKNENYIGLAGGLIITLSSLFLPMIGISAPYLGTQRMSFIDIKKLNLVAMQFRGSVFLIRFFVLLLIFAGIFTMYSYFVKKRLYEIASLGINIILFVLLFIGTEIALMTQLPKVLSSHIGISFMFFGVLLGIILVGISYFIAIKGGKK